MLMLAKVLVRLLRQEDGQVQSLERGVPARRDFADRTHCIAQLRPASSFLLSAPRFLDRQAFDHIDDDGNGTIELSEFKMWMGPI